MIAMYVNKGICVCNCMYVPTARLYWLYFHISPSPILLFKMKSKVVLTRSEDSHAVVGGFA